MYTLSIIIPIYNVEKYIKECLESVIKQLPKDVEVVCVNDGSPDDSMTIARKTVEEYGSDIRQQFKFIDQDNQGLSGARNTGIKASSGRYIGFLDSDDKLVPGYFDSLIKTLNLNHYDIIEFNLINSNNHEIKVSMGSVKSVFSLLKWYSPARVYSRDLFENMLFTPSILYEDLDLTPQLYIKSSKVTYIDKPLYWYRVNQQGITRSFSHQNNINTIRSLELILRKYISLYKKSRNSLHAVIIAHSYYLLCIASCRRFGLKKAFKYINTYQKIVSSLIDINELPIDRKIFDKKITYLIRRPRAYCTSYIVYDSIRSRIQS